MAKKIPRLEKKEKIIGITGYFHNNGLEDVIQYLQSLRDTYKDKYKSLTIETETSYYDDPADFDIFLYGWTEESDEEYNKRVAKIKEKAKQEKERNKKRRIEEERAEREVYERLKKKFESK